MVEQAAGADIYRVISCGIKLSVATVIFILSCFNAVCAAENVFKLDIPAIGVSDALDMLVEETNNSLFYPTDELTSVTANALNGSYTLPEALDILLRGTHLNAAVTAKGVIVVSTTPNIQQNNSDEERAMNTNEGKLNKTITKRSFFAGVAAGLLSVFTPAMVTGQATENTASLVLDEIVVTARKRQESLMKTPVSVTVFSSENLEAMNLTSIDQIADQTPGLVFDAATNISGSPNSSSIFIRGIGGKDYTLAVEPGVGLYVDDVYQAHSIGNVMNIVDVERIEVLRGPQGTLFGRNTIGGAIRVITKKPHDEFEGDVEMTVGSYDRIDIKGHSNIPLSNTFFTRISALSQDRSGFVDRPFLDGKTGDKNSTSVVAQARWLANENFTADALVSYTRDRANGAPSILLVAELVPNTGPDVFRRLVAPVLDPQINNFLFGPQFIGWDGDGCPCIDYSDSVIEQMLDNYSANLNLNWDINDNLAVKSISSFRDLKSKFGRDGDHVPEIQNIDLIFNMEYEQWSQELQISGTSFNDKLEWLLGGYYYFEEGESTDFINLTAFEFISGGAHETETYAFYGQGTYNITDQLDLTLGARYTDEEKTAIIDDKHQVGTGFLGPEGFIVPFPFTFLFVGNPLTLVKGITETDPYVNLSYHWTEHLMTYISYSEGFKGGGVQVRNGPINFLPQYDPEFAKVYEVGAKWSLFDGRLNLSGAGFFTDYTDLQIAANVIHDPSTGIAAPATPGVPPPGTLQAVSVVINAGDAEITGFEIEFTALLTENFRLNGGVSYLDAEYTRLLDTPGITLDTALPNAPEWQVNLSASYEIHTADGTFIPRIDYAFTDRQFNDAQNNTILRRPAVNMLNLSLAYHSANKLWSGALYVTNVLDEQVVIGGFDGVYYGDGILSRPIEWGLRIKRSF